MLHQDQLLQHQGGEACSIPHFSKDGTALSAKERAAAAERKGLCAFCGEVKTHKVAFPLRKVALTNDDVYKGQCLKCYHLRNNALEPGEEKVPFEMYAAWEQRNPGLITPHHHHHHPLRANTTGGTKSASVTTSIKRTNTTGGANRRNHSPVPPPLPRNSKTKLNSSFHSDSINSSVRTSTSVTSASSALQSTTSDTSPSVRTSTSAIRSSTSSIPFGEVIAASPNHRRYNSLGSAASRIKMPQTTHSNRRHRPLPSTGSSTIGPSCSNTRPLSGNNGDIFAQAVLTSASSQDLSMSCHSEQGEHPLLQNGDIEVVNMSVTSFGMESVTETAEVKDLIRPGDEQEWVIEPTEASAEETISPGANIKLDQQLPISVSGAEMCDLDEDIIVSPEGQEETIVGFQLTPVSLPEWLNEESLDGEDGVIPKFYVEEAQQNQVLEQIITTMKVNKCNETIQRNGCFLLRALTSSIHMRDPKLTTIKHRGKICEILVSTMKCNLADAQLVQHACLTIYNLQNDEDSPPCNKESDAASAAVDVLVSSLERYCGDSLAVEVPRAVCVVLHRMLLRNPAIVAAESISAKRSKLMASLQLAIRTYIVDPGLQQHASGIVKVLMANEAFRTDVQVDLSLIELLGRAMDRHRTNLGVLDEAMGALFFCTLVDHAVAATLVASVLDSMAKHPRDATIQGYGCGILRNLSVRRGLVGSIVESTGIQTIIKAMQTHLDNSELQCFACRTLKRLAINEQNELAIQQQGGIDAVRETIRAHPLDADIQLDAFGALVNLTLQKENRTILLQKSNVTASIIAAMKKHRRNANVLQKVLGVILNLSISGSFANAFNELGGIALLVSVMQHHTNDIKIQQSATASLRNFGKSSSCQSAFGACGAYQVIVTSMKAFGGNLKMQIHAIGCLKNAAAQKENSILVSQAGGIHAILSAMRKHQHDSSIQQEGCIALMHLSRVKDIAVAITLNGGTSCAIAAMQQHSTIAGVQSAACGILWNLSTAKSSQKLIAAEKGVDAILKAMMNHPEVLDVNQKACLALCNLASHDDCCFAIKHGCGIETVLDALRKHPSDLHLQKYACKFLYIMLIRSYTVDVLADNGGLPVIKAALDCHGNENADLNKYATKLLDKIQRRLR